MSARWLFIFALIVGLASPSRASRIKDLTMVEGGRDNQLVGYGLVVGLAGDGDSKVSFTVQSVASALKRFGVNVTPEQVKSGNVAAVMLTATIGPFLKPGSRIDVTVSSIGDAKSLQGGVLLQTPLLGADEKVYAVAQGSIAVGGFLGGAGGPGGATVQKNHPTVGSISAGAIVEREIPTQFASNGRMNLLLRAPDFTTAARIAEVINRRFPNCAAARDSTCVNVAVPAKYTNYEVNFLAELGALDAIPDTGARVVINERTGTIIATANVRISTVAISHGALTIAIASNQNVSQPNAGVGGPYDVGGEGGGQTAITNATKTDVTEGGGSFRIVENYPTIERVAAALNALGVSTRDMMSIFQSMKRAGALQAELVME